MTRKGLPFLFLLCSVLCFGSSSPDDSPVIVELKKELLATDIEIDQVDLYNKIAFQLLFRDTTRCKLYIDTASTISTEIGYNEGLARALNIKGLHHIFQNRYDKGIAINKEALSHCEEDHHFVKGKIYNAIGMAYQNMYVLDKSIEQYQDALFHASEHNDTMTMAVVLGNIANVHSIQGNDEEAKYYFLQLEQVSSNHENQNVQFAFHIRFAEFLTKVEEFEESLTYLDKALINAQVLKHNSKIRKVRLQMAINNVSSGNYEYAEICLDSMMSSDIEPTAHTEVRYHYWKADLDYLQTNYSLAYKHAQIALDIINESDDFYFYKPKLLKLLHEVEQKTGNYKEAYGYLVDLNQWQDSIDIKEREKNVLELETKYQSEKREIENALLQEQSNSKTVKLKQKNKLIFASIMAVLMCLSLLYILFMNARKKKQDNALLESKVEERTQKLKKSNEELERFSYIASHDLKEPIRNIKGFTQLLKKKVTPDILTPEIDQYLNIVDKSADQMQFLVDGILDYTKLGDDHTKERVDLNAVVESVKVYLHHLIAQKPTRIVSKQLPTIECSPIQIFQVFKNLIENGIKYNESAERIIEIDSLEDGTFTLINIKDNGIGIESKYKREVFEMFSRLHDRQQYTGSGLGLSIVKKITGLMGGEITLEKKRCNWVCV